MLMTMLLLIVVLLFFAVCCLTPLFYKHIYQTLDVIFTIPFGVSAASYVALASLIIGVLPKLGDSPYERVPAGGCDVIGCG